MTPLAVSLGATGLALLAIAFPLPVYALTLGAFGLVHVLAELRYVDLRFAGRLPRRLVGEWTLLLGAVVVIRALAMTGALAGPPRAVAELAVVGLLALSVLRLVRDAGPRGARVGGLAGLVVLLLLFGSAAAPFETLVVLAFLHNLTPVAFLAERTSGDARRRVLSACAVLFGLVPLLIATGGPRRALAAGGWDGAALAVPGVGGVADHLGAFVPSWIGGAAAVDLFTAAVYLQCLHYAVVIGVLPRLVPAEARRGIVPWPGRSRFVLLLAVVGAVGLFAFARSFAGTRELYGVFAAVHAWVEVPVLLAAPALVAAAPRPA